MGKMQRRKGAEGEREFFRLASAMLGADIKRLLGQARDGGCDGRSGSVAWEVKRRKRIGVLRWLDHLRTQKSGEYSVVAMREDGGRWTVCMDAEEFFALLRKENRHERV